MRLLKCPKCGEMFSDTYKTCPFCQEDEELHSGKPVKTGGRRVGGAKARPKVGGGVVVACLVLVLGLVACTIFGSQFTELFTGGKADTPVRALTLSQRNADLTVGSTVKLTASGGESTISFSSSNEAVATVSADGTVKAVGEGSAVVTAKAGADADAIRHEGMVNINTAAKEELMSLEGIGEKRAEDIISYRNSSGGFKSIDELMNVSGIKQASFDRIKEKIYV